MREQGGGEAEDGEQIGGDDVFGGGGVVGAVGEVFILHDAGVVDEDVERGEAADEVRGEGGEGVEAGHVEDCGGHARIGCRDFVEQSLAAAGDNDLVAELVKGLCQGAADTGAAAGDEDRVVAGLHGGLLQEAG